MVVLFTAVGLLFIALAVPLQRRRVKPNALYGLRVPEALADEVVLHEANARSACDLLWLGVATTGLALALGLRWLPGMAEAVYATVCVGALLLGVVVYAVRGFVIAREVAAEVQSSRSRPNSFTHSSNSPP